MRHARYEQRQSQSIEGARTGTWRPREQATAERAAIQMAELVEWTQMWKHLGSMGKGDIPSTRITHQSNPLRGGSRELIHTDAPVGHVSLLIA